MKTPLTIVIDETSPGVYRARVLPGGADAATAAVVPATPEGTPPPAADSGTGAGEQALDDLLYDHELP